MNGTVRTDISFATVSDAEKQTAFANKRVAIVGGTAGIGLAIANALAQRGAQVTIVGRSAPKEIGTGISHIAADVATLQGVVELVPKLDAAALDYLLFTVGIIPPAQRQVTADGIEIDLAVSYLSRFHILKQIAGQLKTGSVIGIWGFPGGHIEASLDDLNGERNYQQWPQHMKTIVANEALARWTTQDHPGLHIVAFNPGMIKTDIRSKLYAGWYFGGFLGRMIETMVGWFTISPERYAEQAVLAVLAQPQLPAHVVVNQQGQPIEGNTYLTAELVGQIRTQSQALAEQRAKL